MSNAPTSNLAPKVFPPTRWSLVLTAARPNAAAAAAALETLCRTYWYPLYTFVRRSGQSPPDAQDLTQEFFRHLLEKRWLDDAQPDKGKLRNFLVVSLKHFMAKEWRRARAQRRGGLQPHLPLDTAVAESRYAASAPHVLAADEAYDRQWALTLLELSVSRLRSEYEAAGKPDDFAALKETLMAAHGAIDYAAVARRLQTSEGAARVAVHRLRKRFRAVFREEIAQTLADGADLEAEMRHLAAALGRPEN